LAPAFNGGFPRSATATASSSPTPVVFASTRYPYSITLPIGWVASPAVTTWDGTGAPAIEDTAVDAFGPVGERVTFGAFGSAAPTKSLLAAWVADGIERYQKRLKAPFLTEWELIPPSGYESLRARQDESERMLSRLNAYDFVILLDERGKQLDSPQLSSLLAEKLHQSQKIALIIGGAYGVDDTIRAKANLVWSLSPLVFPHQLVRLLLIEQTYRAQEIAAGHPYHHA